MTSKSNVIENSIKNFLKKCKFRKKGKTWYKDYEEVIFVLNLQKSSWGNQFYLNAGIAVKSLYLEEFPKERLCQIRFRLPGSFSTTNDKELASTLDMDNEKYSDVERANLIENEILTTLNFVDKTLSSKMLVVECWKKRLITNCLYHKDLTKLIT